MGGFDKGATVLRSYRSAVHHYLEHLLVERGCSPCTLASYRTNLEQVGAYLQDLLSRPPLLADLTRPRLQIYFNSLSCAPATKAHKKTTLKTFFSWLVAMELYTRNPAALVITPKLPERSPRFLSIEDALQLVFSPLQVPSPTVWDVRDHAVLTCLYGGALRADSVARLTLPCLLHNVPGRGDLTIRQRTKGNKVVQVPVPKGAAQALRAYLLRRSEIVGASKTDRLFLSNRVKGIISPWHAPLSRKGVYLLVRQYGDRFGLKVFPHLLRHSAAHHLNWKDIPIETIRCLLGHSSIETTKRYIGPNLAMLREAMRAHPLERSMEHDVLAQAG